MTPCKQQHVHEVVACTQYAHCLNTLQFSVQCVHDACEFAGGVTDQ